MPWSHPVSLYTAKNQVVLVFVLLCVLYSNLVVAPLSSYAGIEYSFNLDDNEGVCDLFDVHILNYW